MPFTRVGGKTQSALAPVMLRVSRAGRFRARLTVTVRPALLPELAWWRHGAAVSVAVGSGEHAGRVRIVPGGGFSLTGPGGKHAAKGSPNPPAMSIPGFPAMPPDGLGPVVPDWEIVGEALIVTLPWSDAKGATKVPAKEAKPASEAPSAAAADVGPSRRHGVLQRLQKAGGALPVDSLTNSEIRALKDCEAAALAEWEPGRKKWMLTKRGAAAIGAGAAA